MAAPTNWATTRGCARLISACSRTISWKRPSGAGFQHIAQSVMARRRSRRGNLVVLRRRSQGRRDCFAVLAMTKIHVIARRRSRRGNLVVLRRRSQGQRDCFTAFAMTKNHVIARRRSRRGNLFAYRDAPSLRYLVIPAKTRLAERGEVARNGKAGRRINSPRKKPRGSNICVGHLPLRRRCSAAPTGRKVKTTATLTLSPTVALSHCRNVALSLESGRYPAQNGR
jgi:hypothetical protein